VKSRIRQTGKIDGPIGMIFFDFADQILKGQHFSHGDSMDPDGSPVEFSFSKQKAESLSKMKAFSLMEPNPDIINREVKKKIVEKQERIKPVHVFKTILNSPSECKTAGKALPPKMFIFERIFGKLLRPVFLPEYNIFKIRKDKMPEEKEEKKEEQKVSPEESKPSQKKDQKDASSQ
jgi:hypothetical protein